MTVFQPGEWVLLTTDKGKNWLVRLSPGESFSCHLGSISHDDIIGREEGHCWVTPKGVNVFLFRPAMKDLLFHLRRKTQIIYPKDAAMIICYGDIRPGLRVLESGLGSGALTLFLLSAIGPDGMLVSVEMRPEFADLAMDNVRRFLGNLPAQWSVVISDIENPGLKGPFDRIILDLPEPWKAASAASELLKPGGIIATLSPQITQVHAVVKELKRRGFRFLQTFEVLKRDWYIDERRTRPVDRMVAHTGFLTFGRKVILPGAQALQEDLEEENSF
ncbi:tRNA (adenine-N1)-methyltransferase [Thermodesulforhabdus norvegica]|uniref:tRNA (adenine(58)-N(1))-methyltransferase TrmI n=1 Tax=Thermodesulforhabdus norvegica TaxID=39841 RepID=A0A1I4RLL0_9BACT|nr:tRNA (adenine-N1)-methyltransferase [Thermodesulforhabdus norvegica]SFM53069.1 tRNA (adenine-58-N(1)-) methyltransferase [Thermodesulforhabdus norvegica]